LQNIPADLFQGWHEIAVFCVEGMTAETEIEVDGSFTIHTTVKDIPDDIDLMVRIFQLKDAVGTVVQKFEDSFK